MSKKLVDLTIDEVSLVKKGFKPVHQDATIEFFKAYPDETAPQHEEGGFFMRLRKAVAERFTKGIVADAVNRTRPHRELNEATWAMNDALSDLQYGYGAAYGMSPEQRQQAMHDVIDEGTKLMHESVDKIDVTKAMDTTAGANYEQQDLSTNSPGKKKQSSKDGNKFDPDDDGDDDSTPEGDKDHDVFKQKGKVNKAMEEFQKAIEEAMATVPETIKKAVEDATAPHLESIKKAQEDVTAAVEKAGKDVEELVNGAKEAIAKAVDDAKIELGRVTKAAPAAEEPKTQVIKANTSFSDAIRTLMHSGEAN